jgi:hypothetical protein
MTRRSMERAEPRDPIKGLKLQECGLHEREFLSVVGLLFDYLLSLGEP